MTNDELLMRQLLRRFMEGRTTLEEEDRLEEWFRRHPTVDADLEPYRLMFGWMADGLPLDPDGEPIVGSRVPARQADGHRWWLLLAAAAVAVLVAVTLVLSFQKETKAGDGSPAGRQQLLAQVGDTLQRPQKASGTASSSPSTPVARERRGKASRPHRWHATPPREGLALADPDGLAEPQVAITDSMIRLGMRMADAEIAWMNAAVDESRRQMEQGIGQSRAALTQAMRGGRDDESDGNIEVL